MSAAGGLAATPIPGHRATKLPGRKPCAVVLADRSIQDVSESHLTSQRYLPHFSASCGRASAQSPCTETTGSPLRTAPFGKPRGRLPAAKISAKTAVGQIDQGDAGADLGQD